MGGPNSVSRWYSEDRLLDIGWHAGCNSTGVHSLNKKGNKAMKLIRYAYPQSQATSAFNRLFDLGAPAFGRFGSLFDDFMSTEAGYGQPPVDLYEDDSNFYARFELPGIRKEAVDLELENSVLTIRSQDSSESDEKVVRRGFERSISVPDGVELEKVSATMQDGILTVTMPKAEARKPRQIDVN
jgi:HSP20 family protein